MNGKGNEYADVKRLEYLSDIVNKSYYDSAIRTENRIIVDTDILIDHLRGVEKAKDILMSIENNRYTAFISIITKVELLSGKKDEKVFELFQLFHIAPLSERVIALAGDLRRKYKITVPDALIASTAISLDAELVTRNLKHFDMIKELTVGKKAM